ncbi:MAG: hypothetical protein RBQ77_05255 [Candidatus Methanomethylophilaceae archaeon]|mgnify:CR=1 FL=1|nr:hypothetical protein [Candidatus Methanomethylophilaceae archaeon]NLF34071.1 hypothetical protein [Thermoplasmatales archaeon]
MIVSVSEETHCLLESARSYAEAVSAEVSDRRNDPRSMCFWNIHNRIKITEEILGFYESTWMSERVEVTEESEGEAIERMVTVTKDLFVDVVSTIEKTSKEAVRIYRGSGLEEAAMEGRNYLYLRNIIEASRRLGYLSDHEFGEWEDILVMRNLVTHNNSVSDRSKRYAIGSIAISMRPNRMMKGPINTFIVLTDRIISLFYTWLRCIHERFAAGSGA